MIKSLFKDSRETGSIGDRFRAKRFQYFEHCLKRLDKPLKILDVGGAESYWINRGYDQQKELHITLLNLEKQEVNSDNMISVKGDATNLANFKDDEFDIVFSNSVIEHLYSFDNQMKMAKECLRVGKYHFVQTPNKYFFIEPHFRLPFFNFLPKSIALFILTKTKLSLGAKWNQENAKETLKEIRLLDKKEFKKLFPQSNLYVERFLFFRKSFTMHNFLHP